MEKIIEKLMCSGHNCIENNYFSENFKNGIITHCSYDGISMEQNPNIIYHFDNLIHQFKPDLILEIGTFHGGLSLLLHDLLRHNGLKNSKLITYDVNEPNFLYGKLSERAIDVRVKNLFSHDYQSFESYNSKMEIQDLIQSYNNVLVLCDGGSKKNEFRMISDLLKNGDIIMAHDYATDQEYFDTNMKNNRWNWMEIQDSDIEISVIKNNLTTYMFEDFIQVGWVCKMKSNNE